jgi:hypothetical protein
MPAGDIAAYPLDNLPGSARCVGMGRACTAMSGGLDTAAHNPANLGNMDNLEFSAQLRYSEIDGLFLDQDALDSEFFGPAAGQLFKIFKDAGTDLGYLGVGKSIGAWSIAAHYQQQLSFSGAFKDEEVWDIPNNQIFINFNNLKTSIESIGVTASYIFSDRWSAGLTVNNSRMEMNSGDFWQLKSINGSVIPRTGFDSVVIGNQINDDDADTVYSIGVVYRPNPNYSFGLAYHEGGDFNLNSVPLAQMNFASDSTTKTSSEQTTVGLPDTTTFGVTWRPSESMLVALNLDRINYSKLPPIRTTTLGYGSTVEGLTEPINDTISIRLGFEKVFLNRRDNALFNDYTVRLGLFTEEDHDGMVTVDGYDTHAAIGFGVSLGRSKRVRLDMGLEFGDEDKNYIIAISY